MSTALFDVATSIRDRSDEMFSLLQQAQAVRVDDEKLYNALCRSCCVMIASHLEGFLKDLSRSLVRDFTYNLGTFDRMPAAMRRTFCERIATFEGVEKREIDERVRQLMVFFDRNSVPIDFDAFTYKQNINKNPSAAFIDTSLSRVGVPSVVSALSGTPLDIVFDNNTRADFLLSRDLRRYRATLWHFPYKPLPKEYLFDFNKEKIRNSIWHTMIEDILGRRHTIAHGDTMNNPSDHLELQRDVFKVDVLMHGLMYASASYLR